MDDKIEVSPFNQIKNRPSTPPSGFWEKAAVIERVKRWLFRRQFAYRRVFDLKSPYTEVVLNDLARFCRANESTYHTDPRLHASLEGRREVFLRLQHHLQLTPEQLWETYRKVDIHE